MFLSIITINFNNSKGLQKTIESIRMQTCDDFEHIIIDGKSSDESVPIINKSLSDEDYAKKISFWCSEVDKGVYDAMNKGIKHANGTFCLFLNSGDYLADKDVIKRLKNYNLSENSIIYSNAIFFNAKKEWKVKYPQKIDVLFFIGRRSLSHQNMLFPTVFLRENPYSLEYRIAGDVDLYMKGFFYYDKPFDYLDDIISKYENESGMSTVISRNIINEEWDKLLSEYIPTKYLELMKDLYVYEYKYHGILKKLKNLCLLYTKIKHSNNN